MRTTMALLVTGILMASGCATSRPMFTGDGFDGWVEIGSTGAWTIDDGVIYCSGEKDGYAWLGTERKYRDFELDLEWRVPENGNTGVFIRVPEYEGRASMTGFEVQIRDDAADENFTDVSGAVFNRFPASGRYSRPVGEWNQMRITIRGRHLTVLLNGHVTVDADIDTVESMWVVPDEGYIGLQNHGLPPVEFRNVRIREFR